LEYPVNEKLRVVISVKVGDFDLDIFQILSIRIGYVISVITSVVSRWGSITCGWLRWFMHSFYFGQLVVDCLKGI